MESRSSERRPLPRPAGEIGFDESYIGAILNAIHIQKPHQELQVKYWLVFHSQFGNSICLFVYAYQYAIRRVMAHVNILKFGVSSPADTSPMKHLKAAGYDSSSILAVIGKSEGKRLPILPGTKSSFCSRYPAGRLRLASLNFPSNLMWITFQARCGLFSFLVSYSLLMV